MNRRRKVVLNKIKLPAMLSTFAVVLSGLTSASATNLDCADEICSQNNIFVVSIPPDEVQLAGTQTLDSFVQLQNTRCEQVYNFTVDKVLNDEASD